MAKRRRTRKTSRLEATRKNGRKAKANSSVKMKLSDLRRLLKGAQTGRRVKVKARVR